MAVFTVGVLALQGAFVEHIALSRRAAESSRVLSSHSFVFLEVRNAEELSRCDALIIPGGESTTLALVATRSGLLEPLRQFVRSNKKPVWGTCAGLILLAETVDAAKAGGQAVLGGLDVRVHRNHFGRQINSFEGDIDLSFLADKPFRAVFIRAPIVSEVIDHSDVAAARPPVCVLGRVHHAGSVSPDGDIVAVQQGNIFGTSFHPELTDDVRIHAWWLQQAVAGSGQ